MSSVSPENLDLIQAENAVQNIAAAALQAETLHTSQVLVGGLVKVAEHFMPVLSKLEGTDNPHEIARIYIDFVEKEHPSKRTSDALVHVRKLEQQAEARKSA